MRIAKVAVEGLPYFAGGVFSYTLPEELRDSVKKGSRVTVPFGRGNARRRGFVVAIEDENSDIKLKDISGAEYDEFLINEDLIDLAAFMSDKYLCPVYDCIKAMLPAGLDIKISYSYSYVCEGDIEEEDIEIFDHIRANEQESDKNLKALFGECEKNLSRLCSLGVIKKNTLTKRRLSDNTVNMISVKATKEEIEKYLSADNSVINKHRPVIEYVMECGECTQGDLLYMTGVTVSVINTLCKRGILKSEKTEILRNPYKAPKEKIKTELSKEQRDCADEIAKNLGSFSVSLLYGVTGSGKTHVFYDLIDRVTAMGKSAIVMVPEIMLTVQTVNRLKDRFGEDVAVMHSGLSQGERLDEWKRMKRGEAKIAVGTRTAVFAPFENIGLIIMDEEQEHTYKSELSPKYSTSSVAKQRAAYHNALLLLASATPSIESAFWAKRGKYTYHRLEGRYNKKASPTVKVVDMREELQSGNISVLSRELQTELEKNLSVGEQSILFINRRGYNTFVSCRSCGYVEKCPNCSISLTYHKKNGRLMCHYCGYSKEAPVNCPECKSEHIRFFGAGTQKAQEALQEMFPEAKILRMDADTTSQRHAHDKMLEAFSKHEYDILLGTQMVTKGLDFPDVTLVGILAADASLYSEDFRASEKTFALISQVVGRAGRGEKEGRAIIQTYTPSHKTLAFGMTQDYDGFWQEEITHRKMMLYPPFSDICQLLLLSNKEILAAESSRELFEVLSDALTSNKIPSVIIGPSACSIAKMNGMYRYKLLIKCKADKKMRLVLREVLQKFYEDKKHKDIILSTDINPGNIQ